MGVRMCMGWGVSVQEGIHAHGGVWHAQGCGVSKPCPTPSADISTYHIHCLQGSRCPMGPDPEAQVGE